MTGYTNSDKETSEGLTNIEDVRIKNCYKTNEEVIFVRGEISNLRIKLADSYKKIQGQLQNLVVTETSEITDRVVSSPSITDDSNRLVIITQSLAQLATGFPTGFEPTNNITPEMCAACHVKYERPEGKVFHCSPVEKGTHNRIYHDNYTIKSNI